MSATSFYSSLFTAGLYSLPDVGPSSKQVQAPTLTPSSTTFAPSSLGFRAPPASPNRPRTDGNSLRRRRSSITIGSSPMAAIKSPVQRVQFAHRSASKSFSVLVSNPASSGVFPPITETETVTVNRVRKGRVPPPLQKPLPNAPLPSLPPLPFTDLNLSINTIERPMDYARRDSGVLPLPSPTLLFPRAPSNGGLLAPSPVLTPGGRSRGSSISVSSPLLGALDEKDEVEAENMSLDQ